MEYTAGYGLSYALKDRKNLVGAEIGVNDGVTSEFILRNLDIKTLYLVDPWIGYGIEDKAAGSTHLTDIQAQDHEAVTRKRIGFAKDKVIIHKTTSERAAPLITEKLDFVFIDGNHSYDFVKQDLRLWLPKVKVGGIFSGHDFSHLDVNRALRELMYSNPKLKLQLTVNDMWYTTVANNANA